MLAATKLDLQVSKKIPWFRKSPSQLNPKPLAVPVFVLLSLLSEFVEIVVNSGDSYQGFLHCSITKTNIHIMLYKAQCSSCINASGSENYQTLIFSPKNITSICISRYKKISFPGYVTDFINTSPSFQYLSSDNISDDLCLSKKAPDKNPYLTFRTHSFTSQTNETNTIFTRAKKSRVDDNSYKPILANELSLDFNSHVVNNIERKIHDFKFNLNAPAFEPKVTSVPTPNPNLVNPNLPGLLNQVTIDYFISLRRKNASNMKSFKQPGGHFYLLDSVHVPPHF